MRILFVLSFLLITLSSGKFHAYHLSITNIEYVADRQELQIISRVFVDDLENMLRQRVNDDIILNHGRDESSIDLYLGKYIDNKLKISLDDQEQKLNFLGKEYENDAVILYIKVSGVSQFKTCSITNKILFEIFDDQQNIVNIKTASKSRSFLLIADNSSQIFNLN
ncbi:MAG: DUF6702 family protein [Bacteroidota bacterium]